MPFTTADIGTYVLYQKDAVSTKVGRIKAVGNQWMFVVFDCNNRWDRYHTYPSLAVRPATLTRTEAPGGAAGVKDVP